MLREMRTRAASGSGTTSSRLCVFALENDWPAADVAEAPTLLPSALLR